MCVVYSCVWLYMCICGIYMCACVCCIHVCSISIYVCGIYMCVCVVQVHNLCLSCEGQRSTLSAGYVPLLFSLGHLPWANDLPVCALDPASWGSCED